MAEHPNAALARQMTDALSRGDMQALDGFLADDTVREAYFRRCPALGIVRAVPAAGWIVLSWPSPQLTR